MANIALVFPGQGSQVVGMGEDFYNNFPESKQIFDQADEILGLKLKEIIFKGPKDELQKTENAQPALLTCSIAILKALFKDGLSEWLNNKELLLKACAGHSLGEFTAYVFSESLTFEDGLLTVRKRGELMANTDPERKGAMAAIIGLEDNVVEDICKAASTEGIVVPANYNSPGQVVISGDRIAVEKGMTLAKEQKARMTVLLDVSGAFHSSLIGDASREFEYFLTDITFKKPICPVISNVTADIQEVGDIKSSLVNQMTSSVKWQQSVQKMITDMKIFTFIEVGAGKVLQGLVKRIGKNEKITTLGVNSISSLDDTLKKLKEIIKHTKE